MKLEDQVVSLPLAKRLKELGVKQDGYFCWTEQEGYIGLEHWELRRIASGGSEICSAFTVAEMGEMLPELSGTERVDNLPIEERWCCVSIEDIVDHAIGQAAFHAPTEADARAKMLIYLIEKGLVKP